MERVDREGGSSVKLGNTDPTRDGEWSGPAGVLAAHSRRMTTAEAEALLLKDYGISASALPLRSERDQNLLISDADKTRFVLKLANAAQDDRLCGFQIRAMRHIAEVDPALPIPRVVPTRAGALEFRWNDGEIPARRGYLVTFLAGEPVADQPRSPALAASMGGMAARLGRALRGFFDPAAGHELLWDFKHAARLAELLPCIADDQRPQARGGAIARFRDSVAPRLLALRGQVIHNDLNPHNMLVGPDASRLRRSESSISATWCSER